MVRVSLSEYPSPGLSIVISIVKSNLMVILNVAPEPDPSLVVSRKE